MDFSTLDLVDSKMAVARSVPNLMIKSANCFSALCWSSLQP